MSVWCEPNKATQLRVDVPDGYVLVFGDEIISGQVLDKNSGALYNAPFICPDIDGPFCTVGECVLIPTMARNYFIFSDQEKLNIPGIMINGTAFDENGEMYQAPFSVSDSDAKAGKYRSNGESTLSSDVEEEGDEEKHYCPPGTAGEDDELDFLNEFLAKLTMPNIDFPQIPSILGQVVKLTQKIDRATGKLIEKVQNLANRVQFDPGVACDLIREVQKLLMIIQKLQRYIPIILAIIKIIQVAIKLGKLALFFIKNNPITGPAVRAMLTAIALNMLIQSGGIIIGSVKKNVSKLKQSLPGLQAILLGIISQCDFNQGEGGEPCDPTESLKELGRVATGDGDGDASDDLEDEINNDFDANTDDFNNQLATAFDNLNKCINMFDTLEI